MYVYVNPQSKPLLSGLLVLLKRTIYMYMYACLLSATKVGDSIEEVYCNVAVKLSGNITVHTLIDSFKICDIVVNFL